MRRLVACVACGLLLAGCGVLDEEGPAAERTPDPAVFGPDKAVDRQQPAFEAPKLLPPSAEVARELEAGGIGVVDLTGRVTIEPPTLETASDATLEGVRWSEWGEAGARGTGELRLLDCQPTCSSGGTEHLAATVKLSGVKTCDGRRYFATGEVELDSGRQPASYLRAPC